MSKYATFATFILAQCGDKSAAAVVRMETVRAAIVVALKGNKTQWMDAVAAVAKLKTTQAKAFRAAFMATGDIGALFKPQESIPAAEKAAAIEAKADEMVLTFETAYLAELPPEKTADERAAAKAAKVAKKEKEVADGIEAAIKERGLVPADTIATDGQVIAAALQLLLSGKVGETLKDEMRAALGFAEATAAAFADGKAAALAELADKATGTAASRKTAKAADKTAATA